VNKNLVHRELLSKDIANEMETILNKAYSADKTTFAQIMEQQINQAKRQISVAKYAYRWLAYVRGKKINKVNWKRLF